MKLLAHRGLWKDRSTHNTLSALQAAFEKGVGIETDVRSFCGKLYLSHDPITSVGNLLPFEQFLKLALLYPSQTSFLNIKEDGLLPHLREHFTDLREVRPVFFDMSVPELIQYAKVFPSSQLATRMSDFEPSPSALQLCDWIWVDGFKNTIPLENVRAFYESGKKLAFVSPELHGRENKFFWKELISSQWLRTDMIYLCTDLVDDFLMEEL